MATKIYTKEWLEGEAEEMLNWFLEGAKTSPLDCPHNIIQTRYLVRHWCIYRGYPSCYIAGWAKKSPPFAEALNKVKDICLARVLQLTADGEIALAVGIFTLKNISDWTDRKDEKVDGELQVHIHKH